MANKQGAQRPMTAYITRNRNHAMGEIRNKTQQVINALPKPGQHFLKSVQLGRLGRRSAARGRMVRAKGWV